MVPVIISIDKTQKIVAENSHLINILNKLILLTARRGTLILFDFLLCYWTIVGNNFVFQQFMIIEYSSIMFFYLEWCSGLI
jgi:hypothetical protein